MAGMLMLNESVKLDSAVWFTLRCIDAEEKEKSTVPQLSPLYFPLPITFSPPQPHDREIERIPTAGEALAISS